MAGFSRTRRSVRKKARLPGWRRSGIRTSLRTNSLLTGNFTGNPAKSGAHRDSFLQETVVPQRFFSQFPTQNNRENICENRESSRAGRENHVKKQGPLRLVSFATLKTRLLQVRHQPRGVQQRIGDRCPAPSRRARRRAPILVRRSEPASSQVVRIPAFRRNHWAVGPPSLLVTCLPFLASRLASPPTSLLPTVVASTPRPAPDSKRCLGSNSLRGWLG
jgi:hypothetical protein